MVCRHFSTHTTSYCNHADSSVALVGSFLLCNACGIRWRRKLRGVSKRRRSPPPSIPIPASTIPMYHKAMSASLQAPRIRRAPITSCSSAQPDSRPSMAPLPLSLSHLLPFLPTPHTGPHHPTPPYPSPTTTQYSVAHPMSNASPVVLAPLLHMPSPLLPPAPGTLLPISLIRSEKIRDRSPLSIQNLLNDELMP
eukprot:IDg18829t1